MPSGKSHRQICARGSSEAWHSSESTRAAPGVRNTQGETLQAKQALGCSCGWETKSKRSQVQVFSLLHQPTATCSMRPCAILAPGQSRAVILQHTRLGGLLKTPKPHISCLEMQHSPTGW